MNYIVFVIHSLIHPVVYAQKIQYMPKNSKFDFPGFIR
jgi:hypothetical protein